MNICSPLELKINGRLLKYDGILTAQGVLGIDDRKRWRAHKGPECLRFTSGGLERVREQGESVECIVAKRGS